MEYLTEERKSLQEMFRLVLISIMCICQVENKEPATGLNIPWIKKTYEIMQNCGDSSEILNKQISQRPCTFEFDSYFYFFWFDSQTDFT